MKIAVNGIYHPEEEKGEQALEEQKECDTENLSKKKQLRAKLEEAGKKIKQVLEKGGDIVLASAAVISLATAMVALAPASIAISPAVLQALKVLGVAGVSGQVVDTIRKVGTAAKTKKVSLEESLDNSLKALEQNGKSAKLSAGNA